MSRGGSINPQMSITAAANASAFGGIADVTGPTTVSTRSRLTQNGHRIDSSRIIWKSLRFKLHGYRI
jgi:hypothetical protein